MPLPQSSRFQFTPDLTICRILNGMWQVSGAHGAIDPARAIDEMFAYHDFGFTTWDLADHYGPAEDFIGSFRRQFAARHGAQRLAEIQAFTISGRPLLVQRVQAVRPPPETPQP